jgi:CheY-like chemotaxis protein
MTPPARARILIVDDDPDVREVIELTLEGQGYEVTSVAGGQINELELRWDRPQAVVMRDARTRLIVVP